MITVALQARGHDVSGFEKAILSVTLQTNGHESVALEIRDNVVSGFAGQGKFLSVVLQT